MSKPDTVHNLKDPIWWRQVRVFEDLSMNLPLEASLAGMTLTFELPVESSDPIYLKDRYGKILHEWKRVPSLTEVREISQQYLSV